MVILYLTMWPFNDGLSQSTVHPHLIELAQYDSVVAIHYFSSETDSADSWVLDEKIRHHVVLRDVSRGALYNYGAYVRSYWNAVSELIDSDKIDLILCKGSQAGVFGHWAFKKYKIEYVVESFEPHAEYMRQSGTWSWWHPKYLVQRLWERDIKKTATGLITVSQLYAKHLRDNERVAVKFIETVPCWVDVEKFQYSAIERRQIRAKFGISESTICFVYVGKFGGIYDELSVLRSFRIAKEGVGGKEIFCLILTGDDPIPIEKELVRNGFATGDMYVTKAPHDEVGAYLSAADVAFSFIDSGPWAFARSPIKHAEYMAAGLPILAPGGVGDESEWIETQNAGAVVNYSSEESVREGVAAVMEILGRPGHRHELCKLAARYWGRNHLERVYKGVISGTLSG